MILLAFPWLVPYTDNFTTMNIPLHDILVQLYANYDLWNTYLKLFLLRKTGEGKLIEKNCKCVDVNLLYFNGVNGSNILNVCETKKH